MQHMTPSTEVPQALIQALFRHPQALTTILDETGIPPHVVALWARQTGAAAEIEQQAGWLSVSRQPGYYKPLLEVAGSHLRAGELLEALPVFRWAYQVWQSANGQDRRYAAEGVKLLAQWGVCLQRLEQGEAARQRWLQALSLIRDTDTLARLLATLERWADPESYRMVLEQALRRDLPGARRLWQRWQRLQRAQEATGIDNTAVQPATVTSSTGQHTPGVAVLADVANLDMVCRDQYGVHYRPDYARLLALAAQTGDLQARLAFVPDIPETLAVREHLEDAGFVVDLLTPKRSHGRMVANADTAMAAFAVRWASDPSIGRLELWTGDGDFLRVRDAVQQVWPEMTVAFRSFEVGTAAGIRRLGADWTPIEANYVEKE